MIESVNATVLLVDDNAQNLKVLYETLKDRGYHLLIANDGEKALTLANRHNPEVILLDIMMPDLDGYEFLDLKNETLGGEIPVIIVSAKTDTDSIQQAIDKGAYDYISKPFNTRNIINKIRTALGNQDH